VVGFGLAEEFGHTGATVIGRFVEHVPHRRLVLTYAAAFVRRVRDRSQSLAEHAERGRVVPELDDARVRELLVGNYRLIYEVAAGDV
jgi:ParE toxin of type II toxin-antitoxin system, parDE